METFEKLFPAELGDLLPTGVVASKLGLTREGVLAMARQGRIPRPLVLGAKTFRFPRLELVESLARLQEGGHGA